LMIIPLVLLVVRPAATAGLIRRMQEWLVAHGRRVMAYVALVGGLYLTADALVSLL
jgi:hypothetical protein